MSFAARCSLAVPAALFLAGAAGAQQFRDWPLKRFPPLGVYDSNDITTGDVDGDGDVDVVVANAFGDRNRLWLNDGGGGLIDATVEQLPGPPGLDTFDLKLVDVDGDADLDLVLATGRNSTPGLYLNDGAGVFADVTAARMPALVKSGESLAVGDYDGDGDVDVAIGSGLGQGLDLLVNDGSGSFAVVAGAIPVQSAPVCGLTTADLDGDGDLDLVAANCGTTQDRIYANDGTGTFTDATATALPILFDPSFCVAVGDVDGDGDPDIAIGSLNQNRLYRNDGGLVFTDVTAAQFPVDTASSRGVALVDVDGDGDLDALWGNEPSRNGQDGLYLNDGSGGFVNVTSTHMPVEYDYTAAIAAADLDGNGFVDAVTACGLVGGGAPNRAYYNDGTGRFTAPDEPRLQPSERTPFDSRTVVLADIDGDGDLDAAIGDSSRPDRLYDNDGGRLLLSARSLPSRWEPTAAIAGADVDGDGDADLLFGHPPTPNRFGPTGGRNRLFLNDGAAGFVDVTSSHMPVDVDWTTSLAVGDLDADGDLDFIAGTATTSPVTSNVVYANDGAGRFARLPDGLPPDGDETRALALFDADADGDLDVVAGNRGQSRLFRNNGSGRFAPSTGMPAASHDTHALAAGDVDGDGDTDLVLGTSGADQLYLNDGSGVFIDASAGRLPIDSGDTRTVLLTDVDDDGDLDIAAGDLGRNRLLINDGSGVFTEAPARFNDDGDQTHAIAAADLDGDGDADLVAANNGEDRLYVNLHRQLDAPRYPRVGAVHDFEVFSEPGYGGPATALVLLSTALSPVPLPLGSWGQLYLQPPLLSLPPLAIPASGRRAIPLAIPNAAALRGVSISAQAVIATGSGSVRMTGHVTERLR